MLLVRLVCLCVLCGSSVASPIKDVCTGGRFTFSSLNSPPAFIGQMYFTPSRGGPSRLIMDKGLAKDPRIKVSDGYSPAYMTDLTEDDTGNYSVTFGFHFEFNAFRLNVTACTERVTRSYGENYFYKIPQKAELVEFASQPDDPLPRVLWNSSDPQISQGGRGQVRGNSWEILSVTQDDNGCYDFRKKDRKLLSRTLLTVEGNHMRYDKLVGEKLIIEYPSANSAWTVIAKLNEIRKSVTLVDEGTVVTERNLDGRPFSDRVELLRDGLKIYPLKISDSGTYEFKDPQNNIGLTVQLKVEYGEEEQSGVPFVLVTVCSIIGVIGAVVIVICCVTRCCEKGSQASHATRTAEPLPVYYHYPNQSSGPSNSVAQAQDQSHKLLSPGVPGEIAAASSEPPDYLTAISTPQPEFAPLGDQAGPSAPSAPSVSTGCLSSDSALRFELDETTFSTAPPLSSDEHNFL